MRTRLIVIDQKHRADNQTGALQRSSVWVEAGGMPCQRVSTWKIWYCLHVDVGNFIELEDTKLLPDTELLIVWGKQSSKRPVLGEHKIEEPQDGSASKGTCCPAQQPEFNARDPRGGMRELGPESCPLTSTHSHSHST